MTDSLVTLATFSKPTDAYLALGKLQADGIDAVVFDDNVVSVNWLYSNAVGGVKLKVREPEVQRAMEILSEDLSAIAEIDETAPPVQPAVQCPRCSSSAVSPENFSRRAIFLSWLLLGFPLPLFRRRWACASCGHRWKRR